MIALNSYDLRFEVKVKIGAVDLSITVLNFCSKLMKLFNIYC